jgi:hypothetical protein
MIGNLMGNKLGIKGPGKSQAKCRKHLFVGMIGLCIFIQLLAFCGCDGNNKKPANQPRQLIIIY